MGLYGSYYTSGFFLLQSPWASLAPAALWALPELVTVARAMRALSGQMCVTRCEGPASWNRVEDECRVERFERLPQWKRGEPNQVARVTEVHLPALWPN